MLPSHCICTCKILTYIHMFNRRSPWAMRSTLQLDKTIAVFGTTWPGSHSHKKNHFSPDVIIKGATCYQETTYLCPKVVCFWGLFRCKWNARFPHWRGPLHFPILSAIFARPFGNFSAVSRSISAANKIYAQLHKTKTNCCHLMLTLWETTKSAYFFCCCMFFYEILKYFNKNLRNATRTELNIWAILLAFVWNN